MSGWDEEVVNMITEPEIAQPTPKQKKTFDALISDNDALGMYMFMDSFGHDASSPEAGVKISLMHSFPKGQKGKYGAIVNELRKSGEGMFNDYLSGLRASIDGQDDEGIGELCSELSEDVIQKLADSLTNEESKYFEETQSTQ